MFSEIVIASRREFPCRVISMATLAYDADEVLRLLGHNKPPMNEAAE